MTGLGTIINCAAIIAGGLAGHLTGKLFRKEQQDSLTMACGISVLFIAIAGAMQGMLRVDGSELLSGKSMLVVLCLAIGTVIGELLGIEKGFEHFGEWLKRKTGNEGDRGFVNEHHPAFAEDYRRLLALINELLSGTPSENASAFAAETPTSSAPTSPGP